MHLRLVLFALLAAALSGCSWEKRVKRLSDAEFQHYYALRPFMTEDMRKTYVKLDTEEERNAYLKEKGLWEMFYQYSEAERESIVAGEVEEGWSRDMLLMAWGAPYDKQRLVGRPATRSELLIYRFEVQEDGSIYIYEPGSKTEYQAVSRFEQRVTVDDDKVTGIERVEGWH